MTNHKPKLFIGSSSERYDLADKVKEFLSPLADCLTSRDPGIWEPNLSTFDNLLRLSNYFDFGVFVATTDDLSLLRDQLVLLPRDNVILEMALFLGTLGKDKSFLLVEEGVKLPSDFNGIYMPRFQRNDESIKAACAQLKTRIEDHYRLGYLSLYPTTALAIGYYKNFLSGLIETIEKALPITISDVTYSNYKMKVVMPTDLKGSIRNRAGRYYRRHNLVENTLQTEFRKFPAWFQLDPKAAPQAVLYDMPTTLTGIDEAIGMILRKSAHGRTELQELIEQRELNNFRRVLQISLDEESFARECVEIVDED